MFQTLSVKRHYCDVCGKKTGSKFKTCRKCRKRARIIEARLKAGRLPIRFTKRGHRAGISDLS